MTLTTLNAAAQLSLPRWVMARGLSVYLLVSTGSQAIGAYMWGAVATRAGLHIALLWSAVVLGVVALSVAVLPLRPSTGKLNVEVSSAWPTPTLVFEPCPNDGPVLVAVRYRVQTENLERFVEAMSAVRRSRLRTGGHSWRLYHSVEQPDTFLERFTVASWSRVRASAHRAVVGFRFGWRCQGDRLYRRPHPKARLLPRCACAPMMSARNIVR